MKIQKISVVVAMLIVINSPVFSQNKAVKFGKVPDEEVGMNVFQADTSAEAVVLHSLGTSEIDYVQNLGFVLRYTEYKKIKILKKEGLDLGNIEIKLAKGQSNSNSESIETIKAQTYNMEGGKVMISKLEKKEIFSEDVSEYSELKKFAMPNVKVGSVIEYTYTIVSPFFYLRTWYFQSTIPVVYSEYRTIAPEYFEFNRYLSNYHSPTNIYEKSKVCTFPSGKMYNAYEKQYVYENLEAFKKEEYLSSPSDFLAKVEFELKSINVPGELVERYTGSWSEIITHLLEREDFGSALGKHGIVKELSEKINQTDDAEKKLADCYALLQSKIKWNEQYSIYAQTNLRAAFNKGKGNVAEINLLLVNLLNSVGIEAYPVLLSTRDNGKVNMFVPKVSSFNYVVAMVQINDKKIFLDASQELLKIGELPYECLNGQGLVAAKGEPNWVNLRTTEVFGNTNSIQISISDGKLSGIITKTSSSLAARDERQELIKQGKEKFIEDYIKNQENWEIEEYVIENDTNIQKTFVEKLKISSFNGVDLEADIVYIPAIIISNEIKNPFVSETRKYPIDFGAPTKTTYIVNLKIPEGYVIDELPENVAVALENKDASFVYKIEAKDNLIQIFASIDIRKLFFLPQEYDNLRELYSHISEKLNEQIVLKKK